MPFVLAAAWSDVSISSRSRHMHADGCRDPMWWNELAAAAEDGGPIQAAGGGARRKLWTPWERARQHAAADARPGLRS